MKQLYNGLILKDGKWEKDASVIVDGNKIIAIADNELPIVGAERINAHGCYIVPGGIEQHCHGGGGRDFMEGTVEAFRVAIDAHMQHGTTSIFPTLSSSTMPMIYDAVEATEELMKEENSPVLGLHLEGHYLNMDMAGGQIPENIKNPDPEEYIPLLNGTSCIKRWSTAPELPGTEEFGRFCASHDVLNAVAHTKANYSEVKAAYDIGFTHANHFYNAMRGFHKNREYKYEGTVESVLEIQNMTVEMIADGIHVPPVMLRMVYQIKGVERTSLITDSLAVAASKSMRAFDPRVGPTVAKAVAEAARKTGTARI